MLQCVGKLLGCTEAEGLAIEVGDGGEEGDAGGAEIFKIKDVDVRLASVRVPRLLPLADVEVSNRREGEELGLLVARAKENSISEGERDEPCRKRDQRRTAEKGRADSLGVNTRSSIQRYAPWISRRLKPVQHLSSWAR